MAVVSSYYLSVLGPAGLGRAVADRETYFHYFCSQRVVMILLCGFVTGDSNLLDHPSN